MIHTCTYFEPRSQHLTLKYNPVNSQSFIHLKITQIWAIPLGFKQFKAYIHKGIPELHMNLFSPKIKKGKRNKIKNSRILKGLQHGGRNSSNGVNVQVYESWEKPVTANQVSALLLMYLFVCRILCSSRLSSCEIFNSFSFYQIQIAFTLNLKFYISNRMIYKYTISILKYLKYEFIFYLLLNIK